MSLALALATLSGLHALWEDTIHNNRLNYEQELVNEALQNTPYDNDIISTRQSILVVFPTATINVVWKAVYKNQLTAVVVKAVAQGYGGDIIFIIAYNLRGERLGARIVQHRETPGIGDFLHSRGGALRAIDGVSSATITSNAVADAAADIADWVRDNTVMLFN